MPEGPSIYDQILTFSEKQPPWKQDLLRRLVQQGTLAAEDLDAAVQMCKVKHGLYPDQSPIPLPLDAGDLPNQGSPSGGSVTLALLEGLEAVNALLPGQRLCFAPIGLTTVFGYNGSGKSGYARVLKKLCRARGSMDPILTDVFSDSSSTPSGTVSYKIGETEHSWSGELGVDAAPGPDALGHISVYDRASGAAVFTSNQKVELLPSGLDLLPGYRDALDHVAAVLKREGEEDARAKGFPSLATTTTAGRFLDKLHAETSTAELDEATRWHEEDEAALNKAIMEIARLRAEDPAKRAKVLEARASRQERLADALTKVSNDLRDQIADRVLEIHTALAQAQQAQKLQAEDAFSDDELPGTGGEAWRLLWEAAREFSTQVAYPEDPYPTTSEGARCPLCQQSLDEGARERMAAFERFVRNEVARKLEEATLARDKGQRYLERCIPDGLLNGDLRGDEEDVDSALPDRIDTFLQSATLRRDALKSLLASGASGELPPALPEAPTQALRAKAVAHREEAKKLKATSVAKSLELQLDLKAELEARKTLHVHRSLLADEIQRQGRHVKRRAASKDCSTTSLSNLAKKLTGQFVTGALVQGFNRELSTLGGGHLRVCLEGKGARKGDSFTGLALEDKARRAAASKVFSEGEQRAVALAWFLSELAISPTMSAIVFDDPVTSMDHRWREKVASRLAKEAKHRQVIVFTHDAVFLTMISTACSRIGVDHRGLHVQRQGQRPGYCSDEPPWDTKGVRDRVAALTDRHVRLVKAHKLGTDEEYAEAVATFLDRLRKTWERAIEECLFNGCIRRFGPGIETQRIAKIDLIPSDYQAIEAGMGRCSEWVHDPALALANPPPEPVELARMLNALVEWVQQLRARRPKNSLPNLKPISIQAQP